MEGKIICSFFGTGKTYLNKNHHNFIDLEAHYFSGQNDLYIKAIKDASQAYGYNVLIACTKPILELLKKHNLDFVAVLPSKDLKEEYMQRYIDRKTNPVSLKGLELNFEKAIDEVMECDCQKIILKSGQYLKDVIGEII
jgi:DNA-binding LacI/PurR family transcriptional regulator